MAESSFPLLNIKQIKHHKVYLAFIYEKTMIKALEAVTTTLTAMQSAAQTMTKHSDVPTPPRIKRAKKVMRLATSLGLSSPAVTKAKGFIEDYLDKLMDDDGCSEA